MTEDTPVVPTEPTPEDVAIATVFLQRVGDAHLEPAPDDDRRCERCHHYLDPSEPISLCWHPALRTGVGADWHCRHFTPSPTA